MSKRVEVLLFFIIFISLFGQFYILQNTYYSVYPTIELPSGEQVLRDDSFNYSTISIIAYAQNGNRSKVMMEDLLNTMPAIFRLRVINNHLGLPEPNSEKDIPTSKKLHNGKAWIKEKLECITRLSPIDSIRVIRFSVIQRRLPNGQVKMKQKRSNIYTRVL